MDENIEEVTKENTTDFPKHSAKAEKFYQIAVTSWQWIFTLRKILLSIPVLYGVIRLAVYNAGHLGENVGFLLQPDGSFLMSISRGFAIFAPILITCACLTMMFLSRKSLYAWAISVFSLVLPILILFSNIYPA